MYALIPCSCSQECGELLILKSEIFTQMNQPSKAKASLEEALKQNENDVIVGLQLRIGYENNSFYIRSCGSLQN